MTTNQNDTASGRALLAAAGQLFSARGIAAVGVAEIAASAGVTKKTLYDRFGSKDRLVQAYLDDRDAGWRAQLRASLVACDPQPARQLEAVFDASWDWARHHPHGCPMINAHAEIGHSAHPAAATIERHKSWTRAVFTELSAAAGAADPERLGLQLFVIHEGAITANAVLLDAGVYPAAKAAALALLSAATAPG